MSTLQNLPELNILPNRKRDIGSKTPTLTTHTHLYNDPDQKKAETLDQSRITGNALEMPDIGQQQRPKSAIRLTKSPTGSTSSYKSSSITGPQETQESMTFAISEIANKVSKSTFSGEEHEEEESTAQFEPPKPKTFKEPNDDKRTQAFQTAISIANSKPNYSPLSVNQTGGWKAVVQKIQNQGSRNMTNQQAQPERVSTPAHPSSKGITMSKGLSSLIEACNVKNTTNFVKVSFQQQLNIPPKSPIRPSGGFVQNISLMSSVGQLNKNDQVSKDLVKEPAGMERLNKTTPVPSFKDYLQKYKGSTSAATNPMKQSAETFKSPQTPLNIKTSFEMPPKRVAEANTDSNRLAIEDENKALENAKLTPHRRSDENLKENKGFMTAEFKTNAEKTVNTPHPLRQTFGHQTIISTTFKSPKFQIINQIAMPSSTDKEKAQTNLKGYTNVKGSSTRKTHLVPELPIISEVPEIDLKAKKIVNQYKQDRQSVKSSQNLAQFDQLLEIGSESSASQDESESDESEGEDESNETSESIGQGRAINQVQNQHMRKIEFIKPRIPERNNDTQATSEVLECEESEEGDEEGSSSSGSYYEVEEDSSETGIETQKVEKSRSACIDDTFKEHMINNSQSKAESEYEEEGNWDYEDGGGSSEYQLTEEEFESPEGQQVQPYQIEAGREKPQQFNKKLVYNPGVDNPVRQMERYRGHNAQVYEEEDVLRNRGMNGNLSNVDEQRDVFFKHSTMSSTDLILKKYSEIEYRVWDLKGKQWMFDKEVRILQVSMKSLNERIDSLFDLAEGKPSKKDVVLSLTSSELNQIFEDNSQC